MKSQGQLAYEAFNKSIGTTTPYVCPFNRLPEHVKAAWEDAAKAVYELKEDQCISLKE